MAKLPAGVRKKENGTLEKRFTYEGKRYSVYGKNTKELADKENELRGQLQNGTYTKNGNITLDQYFDEWRNRKLKQIKENTMRNYIGSYRLYISPALGKKKIKDIEKRQIQKMLDDLSEKVSAKTRNYTLAVLKTILNEAVRDEIVFRNAASNIRAERSVDDAAQTYHRALTVDEQTAFMDEIKDDFYYEAIALMLLTGMRIGECGALEWSDIDEENNVIHINKTVTRTADGKFVVGDTPKSRAGKRDIPLTDDIKKLLRSQKKKMVMLDGIIKFNNRCFPTIEGALLVTRNVSRVIKRALKRLDAKGIHIEHFTAHALRDTFATRFIESGGNPQTLKTILGHERLEMTMDLYSHVMPNTKQAEMNNMKWNII